MTESTASPGLESALALLERVDACLDKANLTPLWQLSEAETLELVRRATAVTAKLAALRLAAIRDVDTRGSAIAQGAPSTAAWLRGSCRERYGRAKGDVRLARALGERWSATGEDLARGLVSADHAAVIVRTLDSLPDEVDEATLDAAEADLLERASKLDPAWLAKVGKHLKYVLDPDGAKELAAEEARFYEERYLHLVRDDAGWWQLRGRLDPEAGAELATLIDAVSAPRPSTEAGPDPRTAGQRRADGLSELTGLALESRKLPRRGGRRPTVIVQIPYATLLGQAGAGPGTFEDGLPMSAEAARRTACDAGIIPMVLGADSQPLDVGRESYVPSAAMRLAVLVRDGFVCRTPGCGGRPRHTHHIVFWMNGGLTCVDNLVSLCGHCHRLIHRPNPLWTITGVPGGKPQFTRHGPSP